MNKDYIKIINNLQNLNFFNKKNSEVFAYNFLKNKLEYENVFKKAVESLNDLEFCEKCNTVKHLDKCLNCEMKSEKIYIFEDFSDFYILNSKLEEIDKSFVLNFYKKSDYFNDEKINFTYLKLFNFIEVNEITKEIIFMISPSYEREIFKNLLKEKLSKKIIFNEIPLGLPLNSKIKYYDTNLLKELIYKNERSK